MDQNELKLIAHFKVLSGREGGQKIDLLRFTGDDDYAKQVLEIAACSENEELLVLAMDLMQRRNLLPQPKKQAGPAPEKVTDEIDQKYVGALR